MGEPNDSLYDEPAYYRALFAERTADLLAYVRRCRGTERVLELGAGEGRVSFALAAAGHDVVAVERSAAMLDGLEARRRERPGARVRAVLADARTLALGERFERVLLPFNAIAHFHSTADVRRLLAAVDAHLAPGGHFVLDARRGEPARGSACLPRVVHPRTGAVCRLEEQHAWDAAARRWTVTTSLVERETGRAQTLSLTLRPWRDDALVAALLEGGLRVEDREDLGDATLYDCVRAR